ncbi:MAG: tetratricopeptide repeat protein [Anaerolineae bacterium]
MDFLDDLLNRPESQEHPEDEGSDVQRPSRDAPQEASERQKEPLPPSEDLWKDLLKGVSFEEPGETDTANGRSRRWQARTTGGKRTLSAGQKIILGGLGVAVVVLWGIVVLLVSRALRTDDATPARDQPATMVTHTEIPADSVSSPTAAPTSSPEAEAQIDPTSTPALKPTVTPPIFTAYDQQIQSDPDNANLYLQRGNEYLRLGAYSAALLDFETVQALEEDRAEAYVGEGRAYFYMGDWIAAENGLNTAIALDHDLAQAHFELGLVLFYQGRYEEAAREFDWAAEINPTNAEAEAWLAIASAKLGDLEEALGAVHRALTQNDKLAIAYIAQSWARRIQTPPDIDGAQADLLYAMDLAPNDFLTLDAIARFYVDFRPERLAEAEQLSFYARNWAANNVERAVALQTLGQIYLKQGRQADAQRVLEEAASLVSTDGDIMLVGLSEDLAAVRE